MDKNLICPLCGSSNVSKLKDKTNPDRKLFIPCIELVKDGNNKIFSDEGFAFDAYVCNECKTTTLTAPNVENL